MTLYLPDTEFGVYLLEHGFRAGTCCVKDLGDGLTRIFRSKDGAYFTHVFINSEYIHFFKERSCGGEIFTSEAIIDINWDWRLQIDNAFESFDFE